MGKIDEDDAKLSFTGHVTSFDIWALGITIVIGGQYFCWNASLAAGFGSFIIATTLIASAYTCQCICLSEITSTFPISGGAYGLARCTIGFYPGFLVGCCEAIEYITYVATSAISLGFMISIVAPSTTNYQPLIWLAFYVSALLIHIFGGLYFWRFSTIIGVVSILVIFIYCFGSLQYVDFSANVLARNDMFVGGMSTFMYIFPLPAWFYVGVESLNMCSEDVDDPKKKIPLAQISCILTLVATSIFVLFVTCSLPPGVNDLATNLVPFNLGKFVCFYNFILRSAHAFPYLC